eukprot:6214008-Pleurochrysis_carterae.AAC.3
MLSDHLALEVWKFVTSCRRLVCVHFFAFFTLLSRSCTFAQASVCARREVSSWRHAESIKAFGSTSRRRSRLRVRGSSSLKVSRMTTYSASRHWQPPSRRCTSGSTGKSKAPLQRPPPPQTHNRIEQQQGTSVRSVGLRLSWAVRDHIWSFIISPVALVIRRHEWAGDLAQRAIGRSAFEASVVVEQVASDTIGEMRGSGWVWMQARKCEHNENEWSK